MPKRPDEATSAPVIAAMSAAFGPVSLVFPELVSEIVGIDVHGIAPSAAHRHHTLFTTGMSTRPMVVPAGAEAFRHAELVLKLPADWPFPRGEEAREASSEEADRAWRWPVRWVKSVARRPLGTRGWLGHGHLVPNGRKPAPLVAGSTLSGWLLLADPALPEVVRRDGARVQRLVMHGVTREELRFGEDKGTSALVERLRERGVGDVLDPGRKSSVRKKFLGLF